MTPAPTTVAGRIHEALRNGKAPAEVVQDLMSNGLSAASAERIVARALSDASAATVAPGRALPRPRRNAAPALSMQSAGRTGAGVVLSCLLLFGAVSWQRDSRRASRQAFEETRLAALQDASEKRRIAAKAVVLRNAIAEEKVNSRLAQIAKARLNVQTSNHDEIVCGSMVTLETEMVTEAIPDLIAIVDRPTAARWLRNCAAGVLITLGVTDRPLEFFKECLRVGTMEARAFAVSGFGKIGPAVADLAMPVLREELQSPNAFTRRAAVRALGNLGPLAMPLLNQAAHDADAEVRDLAKTVLASK